MGKPKNTPEKFWSKVDIRGEDECWMWNGGRMRSGYGTFILHGKHTCAHRIAYWITTLDDADGFVVAHRCDNPPCVNPKHLFKATQSENLADMRRKGRANDVGQPGESHWKAKLTDQQVRDIRTLYKTGFSQSELGAKFGVGQTHISKIVRGETRSTA